MWNNNVLFFFLFALGLLPLSAQDLKVDSIQIEGKKYFVYPYQFEWTKTKTRNQYERSTTYRVSSKEITPVFDSLPTGEYVMLYRPKNKKEKIKIGARFFISKGKINGPASFYELSGRKTREGNFTDGLMDGEWRIAESFDSTVAHYKNGLPEGEYTRYIDKKKVKHYYVKEKGYINYYETYYDNGQLKISAFSDTLQQFCTTNLFLPKSITGYTESEYEGARWGLDGIPTGDFTVYYNNGRLFGKLYVPSMHSGSIEEMVFDTLYNYYGYPAVIKNRLPDTLGHQRQRIDYYTTDNRLWSRVYLEKDSTTRFNEYQRFERNQKGEIELTYIKYTTFLPDGWANAKPDSLFLISYEKTDDKTDSVFVCVNTDLYFHKISDPATKYSSDFKFYYAPNLYTHRYEITEKFDELTLITYTQNDSNSANQFSMGSIFSDFNVDEYEHIDSLRVYYRDQPYTGKITLTSGDKAGILKSKPKHIIYSIGDEYTNATNFISAEFANGQMKKITVDFYSNFDNEPLISVLELKNNLPEGKFEEYFGTTKNAKNKFIEQHLEKGLKHGQSLLWSVNDDNKKYLRQKSNFNKGLLTDTFYSYYSNGDVAVKTPYYLGRQNGLETEYFSGGMIYRSGNYKNGEPEGLHYSLGLDGDTIRKDFYENGELHGKRIVSFKGNKVFEEYDHGTLINDLILEDEFKNTRLKLHIDTLYNDYLDERTLLTGWYYQIIFAGKVCLYHPNGKLFTEGKTKISRTEYGEAYTAKSGLWTYYNSVGRKTAEVNYDKKEYQHYYDNGSLKYSGKFIEEEKISDCTSDLADLKFIVEYTTALSENGDTLAQNGNGKIKIYSLFGTLLEEGQLQNSKKQGWWKEYSKEGKLIAAGQYVNGQKIGRWLSGDLTGINYLDDKCFESEEIKQRLENALKYNIEILEEIYENGVQKSYHTYRFTRSVK